MPGNTFWISRGNYIADRGREEEPGNMLQERFRDLLEIMATCRCQQKNRSCGIFFPRKTDRYPGKKDCRLFDRAPDEEAWKNKTEDVANDFYDEHVLISRSHICPWIFPAAYFLALPLCPCLRYSSLACSPHLVAFRPIISRSHIWVKVYETYTKEDFLKIETERTEQYMSHVKES